MSHFAKVIDGIVTEIIVSEKDFINSGSVGDEFLWVQTSYNSNFRGNYAEVGGTYSNGIFIAKQPFDSWVLNDLNKWVPPVDMPTGKESYTWNETTGQWDIHPNSRGVN
jgi:hypothetical protein